MSRAGGGSPAIWGRSSMETELLTGAPRKEEPKGRGQKEDRQTDREGKSRRGTGDSGSTEEGAHGCIGRHGCHRPPPNPSHLPVNREEGLGSVVQWWSVSKACMRFSP